MPKYTITICGDGPALEPTPDSAPYTADELARRFTTQLRDRGHAILAAGIAVFDDTGTGGVHALATDVPEQSSPVVLEAATVADSVVPTDE